METSKTNLTEKSELNIDHNKPNEDQHSTQDLNQLACCLKNAIFSKYISSYLIKKTEEMWILYEKRIDKYLQEKHFDIACHHTRPQIAIQLEEFAKNELENIDTCKRDIEVLCSSRKRLRNDLQSKSGVSIHVPKTPRCIDCYENNLNEFDDLTLSKIPNPPNCIFQHGEILPFDSNPKSRRIRITYICND